MAEKKIGRPRKYEGDEKQRRKQANKIYLKKAFKQLNIRIPFPLFSELQSKAQAKNISVRQFIMQKISE